MTMILPTHLTIDPSSTYAGMQAAQNFCSSLGSNDERYNEKSSAAAVNARLGRAAAAVGATDNDISVANNPSDKASLPAEL